MFTRLAPSFSLALVFLSVVTAQSTNNTDSQLDIEAIEANFQNAGIVPSLLPQFQPIAVLDVSFDNIGSLTPGQNLTIDQVKPTPHLSVVPANSSVQLGSLFTLAMVDADVVGTDESQPQTRHWLVNNVTLNQDVPDFTSAVNITDYASPLPAAGSGPHRYVILLYRQPDNFTPPANLSSPNTPVAKFDFLQYVTSTGLQDPVAGFYIQVEQGTATVSLSATSAVITSTLSAGISTQSSTTGSSGAAAPSPTSNAQKILISTVLTVFCFVGSLLLV